MLKLAVLCSGGLGLDTLKKVKNKYKIECILTDSNSKGIIDCAEQSKTPCFRGNPRNGKGYHFIKAFDIDVIISVNYLFLLESDIINHSNILTFNIHGSLLPKYRGRTPHVWAIINGETKAGITAHQIDSGCDTGKIIHQIEVPITNDDTGASILDKYTKLYFPLIEKVLNDVVGGNLILYPQDQESSTYFGKRTPSDGEINWDWDKERIRNWVRAQSYPYPGAFTFLDGKKIIIDKVVCLNQERVKSAANGEIVQTTPKVLVNVKDGLIILETIRTENCNFEKGNKFENENRK